MNRQTADARYDARYVGIKAEIDVASAATTDIGAAAGTQVRITGTTTITSFGTVAAGTIRRGRFAGALTLTHNATSLILPGAANITTAANDSFEAMSLGSGNWIVLSYQRASGAAIVAVRDDGFALAASVSANALTVALKGADGNDPSASNPVRLSFRSATATSGTPDIISVTSALSVVASSGSTLGTSANVAFRFWVVAFNDSGTVRLALINCRTAAGVVPLNLDAGASSTAEGGAGAADTAGVFYSGTAVTNKAYVILGYVEYGSGLGTPGTYSSGPSLVAIHRLGGKLPGDVVQARHISTTGLATGTTTIPYDDTIPQNTEGDQYLTTTLTPSSSATVLDIDVQLVVYHSASSVIASALFQDSTANALAAASIIFNAPLGYASVITMRHVMTAGITSATTFNVRAGGDVAGTLTLNGTSGNRRFGGVSCSYLAIKEMQA